MNSPIHIGQVKQNKISLFCFFDIVFINKPINYLLPPIILSLVNGRPDNHRLDIIPDFLCTLKDA